MTTPIDESITTQELNDRLRTALQDRFVPDGSDMYVWVDDIALDEPWLIYCLDGHYFRIGYTVTDTQTGTVALVGDPTEVIRNVEWVAKIGEADDGDLVGDIVPLVESTLRRDGTVPIKLIAPGWSANGRYYSTEVLERDGADAFPAGTHMFWDHPTATEAADRPERSLRDLSAVTISDARFDENGPAGPGLYADAKVLSDYQGAVEELAPYIGVSIRAGGQVTYGEAEGKTGQLVEQITVGRSVDFVTTPAAGGEIVSLFESIRGSGPSPSLKEHTMSTPTELAEAQRQLTEATTALTEAHTQLEEARALGTLAAADRDRFREQLVLREARDHVAVKLAALDGDQALPDLTKARLLESISSNPPVADTGTLDTTALDTRIEEAIKTEREYLAGLTGSGTVMGLGGSTGPSDAPALAESSTRLTNAFGRLGLSESAAQAAANGR